MRPPLLGVVLSLQLVPGAVSAESLGDAARQEAERRRIVREQGGAGGRIGETELFRTRQQREREGALLDADEPAAPDAAPGSDAADESGGEPRAEKGEGTPAAPRPADQQAQPAREPTEAELLDRERRQREVDERAWRLRVVAATERLEQAQREYDSVKGIVVYPGTVLIDENNRPLPDPTAAVQAVVAQTKEELENAQRAYDELLETARREGVPPGWLR